MVWAYLVVIAVTLILGVALAPKAPGPKPSSIDDFNLPTAEQGRPIPVVFGEIDIRGSNVLWYGDLNVKPIRKRSGFSKSTVGFKYYLGSHEGLCHGPVDAVVAILAGDKIAWTGSATSNTTISIDQPNLFGGEKREGGISGQVDICMGGTSQTANSYLNSKQGPLAVPGYRGILGIVCRSGSSGMYVGTTAYPKPRTYRVRRILEGWHGGTAFYAAKAVINTNQMNPAHIVYQCLTDPRWGMGMDFTQIDSTSFMAAADKLFEEDFGLNLLWNQATQIEEFIQVVLDHVAGALTLNENTGKLQLELIRGDYEIDDLDEYDESNVVALTDYQRIGWGETVNEVTVVYTDPTTRKDTSISQQDMGNIDAQGARVPMVIQRKGIRDHAVARVVLARELQSRSTPLSKITIEVNRKAWNVKYGGLFKFTWAERSIDGLVYRVLKVSKGTLTKGSIKIDALEDVFALGVTSSLASPSDPEYGDPPDTPDDIVDTGNNVLNTTLLTPPVSPADGDSYFIPEGAGSATGAWAGHEGQVADWDAESGMWIFSSIPANSVIYDEDSGEYSTVVPGMALQPPPWARPLTTKGDLLVHNGTTLVRLAVGADDKILTANSGASAGISWEDAPTGGGGGGGGGGDTPWITPLDDVPASPDAMDDEFDDASFDTVKWTWINQGGATVTEDGTSEEHLILNTPASSGDNYRMIYQTLPGGNWKFRMKTFSAMTLSNFAHAGLFVRNSANGKFYAFGHLYASNTGILIQAMDSVSSYSGTPYSFSTSVDFSTYLYLDVEYNGTNLIFSWAAVTLSSLRKNPFVSLNPTFVTALTVTPATFLGATPDQIGIQGDSNNNQTVKTYVEFFRRLS